MKRFVNTKNVIVMIISVIACVIVGAIVKAFKSNKD